MSLLDIANHYSKSNKFRYHINRLPHFDSYELVCFTMTPFKVVDRIEFSVQKVISTYYNDVKETHTIVKNWVENIEVVETSKLAEVLR